MNRLSAKPACLIFVAALVLFAAPPVAALQPAASNGGSTVCAGVPAETGSVLDSSVATAEDVQAFYQAVKALTTEIDALCRQDKTALKRIKHQAKSVAFEMSAGATEPTPYLNGGRLVVEFYGGAFDAQAFRRAARKALLGQRVPHND
ncbi:MAG: hypothetical protein JNM60_03110 [Candidatus Competibacteraceae bacterium]|nr:hypothetical protein [Candidatus Competibacteraceae bacterium]